VYAASVDNEWAFARQTIRDYPGIFERKLRSIMRRVEVVIEIHGGHFEH
jgi:hypothetical protein